MSWPHSFSQVTPRVETRGFGAPMGPEWVGTGHWVSLGSLEAGRRRMVRTRYLQVTQEAGGSFGINGDIGWSKLNPRMKPEA